MLRLRHWLMLVSCVIIAVGTLGTLELGHAEFTPCHTINSGDPVPRGFAAPYNVLSPEQELIFKGFCDVARSEVEIEVGNGSDSQYVYKQGHYWDANVRHQFVLSCDGRESNNTWCVGSARHTISLSDLSRVNGVIAYVCTRVGLEWKCGCRDQACLNQFWNVQGFQSSGSEVSSEEVAFLRDVEMPAIQEKQSLQFRRASKLWNGAQEVLSVRAVEAVASGNTPDCKISMWVGAANQAGRRLVVEAFSPVITTLLTGGLPPLLSSFSTPGRVLIAEALGLSVSLLNDAAFGILDTAKISIEVAQSIVRISVGFIAPLITRDYFEENLAEILLNMGLERGVRELMDREEMFVYEDEGSNLGSRNWPSPVVKTKIILIYSPFTHYVTLFLRAGGDTCSDSEALFVLRYEADGNGLRIHGTLREDRINIER